MPDPGWKESLRGLLPDLTENDLFEIEMIIIRDLTGPLEATIEHLERTIEDLENGDRSA